MAKSKLTDRYSNRAYGTVTMSAANTLTFTAITFGVGLFQGMAILLHRIKWSPTMASLREIVAATDSLTFALTTSNRITALTDSNDPGVVDWVRMVGIAANIEQVKEPIISDYTMLPSGGKLIPANPLYLAAYTLGAAAASEVRAELEFTFVELEAADYLELIQSNYPANVI